MHRHQRQQRHHHQQPRARPQPRLAPPLRGGRAAAALGCAAVCILQLRLAWRWGDASPFLATKSQLRRFVFASSSPGSSPAAAATTSGAQTRTREEQESVAACLVVMDDNHWLIEWMAYHYHVLPLRTLVVVQDPMSRTSPLPILDRWRSRVNITVWTDEIFLKPWVLRRYREGRIPQWRLHRSRQQFFYPACLRFLKSSEPQSGWVALVDTDEFVRPSPYYYSPHPQTQQAADLSQPGSVLAALRAHDRSSDGTAACIHVPRLQFSSRPADEADREAAKAMVLDPTEESQLDGVEKRLLFNSSHLLTTSWFYHAGKEISTGHAHLDGKNLVHVGRVSPQSIPDKLKTVHHVLEKACPVKVPRNETPLIVHHYLGTLEQFTSRSDPRDSIPGRPKRDRALYEKYKGKARDLSAMAWLPGFVRSVGAAEARRLLDGVGQVVRAS